MATTSGAILPVEDSSLTGSERRIFSSYATGWALEGMDFMIYRLVGEVGGWAAGNIADRVGATTTDDVLAFTLFASLRVRSNSE